MLGEMPGDKADAHGRIAGGSELLLDPFGPEIAGPQQTQAAGRRHRRRQPAAGDGTHGRADDGVSDGQ